MAIAPLRKPITFEGKVIRAIPIKHPSKRMLREVDDALRVARSGAEGGFSVAQVQSGIRAIAAFTGWPEDQVADLDFRDLIVVAEAIDRHFAAAMASVHRHGGRA